MTPTLQDSGIVKTDGVGRVRTPPERRDQLLDEFDRSGLSGPKFAALVGIKYPTFAGWILKRRRSRSISDAAPPAQPGPLHWLEAMVDDSRSALAANPHALMVELPGGARLLLAHPDQAELVARMLRALAKPC